MSDNHRPTWVPDWFPKQGTLEYSGKFIQLGILLLAAAFLLTHLFKGQLGKAAGTAAGATS